MRRCSYRATPHVTACGMMCLLMVLLFFSPSFPQQVQPVTRANQGPSFSCCNSSPSALTYRYADNTKCRSYCPYSLQATRPSPFSPVFLSKGGLGRIAMACARVGVPRHNSTVPEIGPCTKQMQRGSPANRIHTPSQPLLSKQPAKNTKHNGVRTTHPIRNRIVTVARAQEPRLPSVPLGRNAD